MVTSERREVGKRWGKVSPHEGHAKNVGPALAHMVANAKATLAVSVKGVLK